MSESVEDIVQSFVDHDLSILDSFGEISHEPKDDHQQQQPQSDLQIQSKPQQLKQSQSQSQLLSQPPSRPQHPPSPSTPTTPDPQSTTSFGVFQTETPNSMLSSTSSIDSIDHYTTVNGSRIKPIRKSSTNHTADTKISNKLKMFGRRIVSSTTTSPTTISSSDYENYQQPHTSISRVPTIKMRFSTENPTA